jgi:hypothetical protein
MPAFACSDLGKTSMIANLHIEIQDQYLQNMKKECKKLCIRVTAYITEHKLQKPNTTR